jgi:hypothetical protein
VACSAYPADSLCSTREKSLLPWLLKEPIGGPLGLGSPTCNADFVFLDACSDENGLSEVGSGAVHLMGLSTADVTALTKAYWHNHDISTGSFLTCCFSARHHGVPAEKRD